MAAGGEAELRLLPGGRREPADFRVWDGISAGLEVVVVNSPSQSSKHVGKEIDQNSLLMGTR